jgi:DnaJ-class molecular chaperone
MKCTQCDGTGKEQRHSESGMDITFVYVCQKCNGNGVASVPCPACEGIGYDDVAREPCCVCAGHGTVSAELAATIVAAKAEADP